MQSFAPRSALGHSSIRAAAAAVACALAVPQAQAQELTTGQLVVPPEASSGRKDGVTAGALVAGSFNFNNNRSVVGQPDGTSLTLGASFDGAVDVNSDHSEWRSTLGLAEGVTKTPSSDEFVKTRDTLAFETIYLHHVLPALGPFARFALNTVILPGYDIRGASTVYQIARVDGTTETLGGRRLRLTDTFQPLTLKESVGVFVHPITTDRLRAELRAGPGAQQVFAEGALAIDDDAATPVTEVKELESYWQVGAEVVATAWGTIDHDKRIAYNLGLGILVPLAHSELPAGDERGAFELTNIELTAGLSVKLVEWASLDYKLAVLRQPQLIDAIQVSNNILLTVGLGVGTKAPSPPDPPPVCVDPPAPVVVPPPAAEPAPAPAVAPPDPVEPAPAVPAPATPAPVTPPVAAPAPATAPPPP